MHDLVVEGGTIVTATESYRGDVGIIDGKIATLGKNLKGKKTCNIRRGNRPDLLIAN